MLALFNDRDNGQQIERCIDKCAGFTAGQATVS